MDNLSIYEPTVEEDALAAAEQILREAGIEFEVEEEQYWFLPAETPLAA